VLNVASLAQLRRDEGPALDEREAQRRHRSRQAWRTTTAGLLARIVTLGVRFLSVPLALKVLGAEGYGLWLTSWSLVTWLLLGDAGLSVGLISSLSKAAANNDRDTLQRLVSTAVFSLLAVSVLVALGTAVILFLPDPGRLLGLAGGHRLAAEARSLILVAGWISAVSVCTNSVSTICAGLQIGYLGSASLVAGSLLSLGCLALMAIFGGGLIGFALASGLPPVLANVALAGYLFGWREPGLRPRIRLWHRGTYCAMARTGVLIFAVQFGEMAMLQSSNLIIAGHLGPAVVPQYSVAFGLLMQVMSLSYIFTFPLWSAYAEADQRGDLPWIRSILRHNILTTQTLTGAGALGLLVFGRSFIGLWAGKPAVPPQSLLTAMAVYCLIWQWSSSIAVLLNGLSQMWLRAIMAPVTGAIFVGASLVLLPRLGLCGIPIAGLIATSLDATVATAYARRYLNRRARFAVQ
jgi:O-antigen/teichoic acid export membrane protein